MAYSVLGQLFFTTQMTPSVRSPDESDPSWCFINADNRTLLASEGTATAWFGETLYAPPRRKSMNALAVGRLVGDLDIPFGRGWGAPGYYVWSYRTILLIDS